MFIEVTIQKPLYGSMVYIRDKYLREAKSCNMALHITVPGIGEAYCTWEQWVTDAKIMYKEFLIPGKPMKLYGNYINKFNASE